MKILFVVPCIRTAVEFFSRVYPMPLGLASISAFLRKEGYKDITIKDFLVPPNKIIMKTPPSLKGKRMGYYHYGSSYEEVNSWAQEHASNYDIIGITSMQINTVEDGCCKVVDIFKQHTKAPIIVGGYSATTNPEFILSHSKVDYIIRGEGELPFLQFLRDYEKGILPNKPIVNKHFIQISDLDTLPFPAWDLVELDKYPTYHKLKRIVLTTSRGCPFDCRFCSVKTIMGKEINGKCYPFWRRNSPEYVIKLVKHLYNTFGIRFFCILDDNFLADIKRAKTILDGVESLGLKGIRWYIEEGIMVRQGAKHPELLEQLVRMKFENIVLGLETFSEKTIEYIRKPETIQEFEQVISTFNKLKYKPNVFYILGFPTDTIKSMIEAMIELTRFKISIRVNNLQLLPKTDIWYEYIENGLINPETWDFRLSGFYTPPTENFDFKDIMYLKRLLNGINFACENGIDVFRESLESIKEKMSKYNLEIETDRIKVESTSTFGKTIRKVTSFLTILAYRLGFNTVKIIKKDKTITLVDTPHGKINNVEKTLKTLLVKKNMLITGKHGLEVWLHA